MRWIVKHIDNWFEFARRLELGIENMEEIILVTGCDLTKSWTNIAFLENEVDAQVSFGVRVKGPTSNPSVDFQFLPENARGVVLRHGPEGTVRLHAIKNSRRHDFVFIRTCLRINVSLSEDFVLPVPSGYRQGILKRPQVLLQTQRVTSVIQTQNLYQYP